MIPEDIPICCPSYKRWSRRENKTMTIIDECCSDDMRERTYLFVRREQYDRYAENFPRLKIIKLPDVGGLSTTRQFIADYTIDVLKAPYNIDIDDDITNVGRIVIDGGKAHDRGTRETFEKSLNFASCIALDAFEQADCIIGGLRRRHFSATLNNARTAYYVNSGPTPRHIVYQNVKMMRDRGIRRDKRFDPTGDDVGLVAVCAAKRQNFFHIPCVVYGYVKDEKNSVIRNDGNRRQLAEYEMRQLMSYPMGRYYMRVPFRFDDGGYKFSDIDFAKYRRHTGLPMIKVQLSEGVIEL